MITIRGYHGYLKPKDAKRMDKIAMVVEDRVEWEWEGTISEFADAWGEKFLFWPNLKDERPKCIFVTSHPTFGTYG